MGTGAEPIGDGCTLWFDGWFGVSWRDCCDTHDLDYANLIDKITADFDLGLCVAQSGGVFMGILMLVGVSLFGWIFYPRKRKTSDTFE